MGPMRLVGPPARAARLHAASGATRRTRPPPPEQQRTTCPRAGVFNTARWIGVKRGAGPARAARRGSEETAGRTVVSAHRRGAAAGAFPAAPLPLDVFADGAPDVTPYDARPPDRRIFDPDQALEPFDRGFNWKQLAASPRLDDPGDMRRPFNEPGTALSGVVMGAPRAGGHAPAAPPRR